MGRSKDAEEPNELDISFIRNQTLSIVECKSGSQEHDKSGDVFHKTEAIKKLFGAIRTDSFLCSTGGNLVDASGEVKSHFQTRAANYRCPVLTAKEIRELSEPSNQIELIKKYMFGAKV